MAVSAGAVLLVTAGGVLAYAGFTGRSPLDALKELSTGKPTTSLGSALGSVGMDVLTDAYTDAVAGEGLPALPRAVQQFKGDRYSQVKRNQKGYSDCSSFVGKGLKAIGIKPPPGSTTTAYLASRDWKRIPSGDVRAGDVAISLNHMVICYGNGNGIGQQNPRSNVRTGKVDDLMIGNKPYVFLRYVAGTAKPKSPPSAAT